jgi:hypothetical protein
MAFITTSQNFSTGNQVTASSLNAIVSGAEISTGSVDDQTIVVSTGASSGILSVKSGGISSTQLGTNIKDSTGTTDGVTFSKLRYLGDLKVIGNVSGSSAQPTEVTVNNSDTLSGASATTLATDVSIKNYVDSDAVKLAGFNPATVSAGSTDGTGNRGTTMLLPNSLVMKVGAQAPADGTTTTTTITFADSSAGGSNFASVYSANVDVEKSEALADNKAYVKSLSTTTLVIEHTAGVTRVHYTVYGT